MMKKILLIISLLLLYLSRINSQQAGDTSVCLITCGPGIETYSIYGHSALRVVIPGKKSDNVYNWGLFDFSEPNFTWKFAKGRLNYLLGVESMQNFLQSYFYEKRFVQSQRINLTAGETAQLISLINENLKPANIKYRYDFFYDDCSTRIRDIIEKSIGGKLLYPPDVNDKQPTFRDMVGKYQHPYPWLTFGIHLIMGSPGDKKASFRDRMFLPIDLQDGLSETVINRDGKMIPLLQNPDIILDYPAPDVKKNILLMPAFVFTYLLIIVIILPALIRSKKYIRLFDIIILAVFSVMAIMMVFFNFFTDHQQMRWNLNIIWLNPFILICFMILLLNRKGEIWFRVLFYISVIFLVLHLFLPQSFNIAFLPLTIILIVRSSVRAGFEWNPHSLK
jgi:hypothetical protein